MQNTIPAPVVHAGPSQGRLARSLRLTICALAFLEAALAAPTAPAAQAAQPAPAAPAANVLAAPCHPGPTALCLYDGRLQARVEWDAAAAPRSLPLGDAAGAFFDAGGDPALVLRVADGRALNGHFWLLLQAAPGSSYRLTLEDLATGESQTYAGNASRPAESDLLALRARPAAAPAGAAPAAPADGADGAAVAAASAAAEALADSVTVTAVPAAGSAAGPAAGAPLEAEPVDAATVAFRSPGSRDPELVASVLDGREVNGSWWLLATATHGGAWDLTLEDRGTGTARRVHVAAAGPGTQWFSAALSASPAVHVTLDTARAVKKTITAAGGSIQAVAANGTKFILSIPAAGLDSSEDVTLTPIKSAQHLPFTPGFVAGVEIGPAGLRFGSSARLAIQPAQAVALPQETTFAYRAGGSQFFLYPADIGSRPVALEVLHAGGYGLARAAAAEQTAQGKRLPAKPEDQFDQRLWHEHWLLRQGLKSAAGDDRAASDGGAASDGHAAIDGRDDGEAADGREPGAAGTPPPAAAPETGGGGDLGFLQDDYNNSLAKTLADISATCDGLKKWGYYARNFISAATADGLSAQLGSQIGAIRIALEHGEAQCYDDATTACNGGDHTQPVPALQWWNQLLRDGATSLVDSGKLASCLVFDLEWDTLVLHSNPAPEGYLISASHRLDTHALVHFQVPPRGVPSGSSPPTPNNYVYAKWLGGAPKRCTITATGLTQPDNFTVSHLGFDVNLYEDNPPPPKIDLIYSTGNPQMQLAETCTGGGTKKYYQGLFSPAYFGLHFLEEPTLAAPGPGFGAFTYEPVSTTWQVKQGALFAVRTYDDTLDVGVIHLQESTDLNLFHKPGR